MAKLFLSENEIFTVVNEANVFGALGLETIKVSENAGVTIDQGVERIEFNGVLSNYTFALKGNVLLVNYQGKDAAHSGLAAKVAINQTKLAFQDGSADFIIKGLSIGELGGGVVRDTEQAVNATLDPADGSSVGVLVDQVINKIQVSPVGIDSNGDSFENAGNGDIGFYFDQGSYNYVIDDFNKGDSLHFKAGDALSITNLAADGTLALQASDALTGTSVQVTLTGLDPALDSTIFNTSSFLSAFGADSLIA
jgi:hypothetical protein